MRCSTAILVSLTLAFLLAAEYGAPAAVEHGMQPIGYRGVPSQAPPNTLAGLRGAIALGQDLVVVTLRTTADGKIVDLHAATLDAGTDGHGPVTAATLAQVRRLTAGAAGERVPLFAEELALAKGRIKVLADLKAANPLEALWLVEQFDMVGEVVFCGSREALAALRRANPKVKTAAAPPAPKVLRGGAQEPAPEPPPVARPRADARRVKIIAHRGYKKIAPQNTLLSARAAIAIGLDYIEVDLRSTGDGLLIDMHNDDVDKTTNGHGLARALRYAQIRALDAGSWFGPQFKGARVPLFGEVLALAKGRAGCYLDWKDADPKPAVRLLQAFDMTREVLVHADPGTCRQVRALDRTIPLMPGADNADGVRALAAALHPEVIELRWTSFSPESAQACRDAGIIPGTSFAGGRGDTPEDVRRAVGAGLQIIETDEPEMFLEVLASLQPAGG